MTEHPSDAVAAHFGAEERAYLLKRAADHAQLAEKASESAIRSVHLQLRDLYQTRAETVKMVVRD